MLNIRIKVLTITAAVLFVGSCTKTNHSVYMTVSGSSSSTKIKYGEATNMNDAENKDATTITVSSLPWTSSTYNVKGGDIEAFYLYACNESSGTANITITIYDNGNKVATSTCDTASCICQQVSFVAN
jgi:hypothetical protein